jgi:hypothetical protein
MYAAHFAAGLAVKGGAPRAPMWAVMTAAFLPDFVWIVLAGLGVEPTVPRFFDDWSHSLAMIVVWSALFAAWFWRERAIAIAVFVAGMSHFVLDFLIHPARLALYPHSRVHLGWELWYFSTTRSWLGATRYWWVEMCAVVVLLALFVVLARRNRMEMNLVAASCVLVVGLHLMGVA